MGLEVAVESIPLGVAYVVGPVRLVVRPADVRLYVAGTLVRREADGGELVERVSRLAFMGLCGARVMVVRGDPLLSLRPLPPQPDPLADLFSWTRSAVDVVYWLRPARRRLAAASSDGYGLLLGTPKPWGDATLLAVEGGRVRRARLGWGSWYPAYLSSLKALLCTATRRLASDAQPTFVGGDFRWAALVGRRAALDITKELEEL